MNSTTTKYPSFGEWQARRGIEPWTFKHSILEMRKAAEEMTHSLNRMKTSLERATNNFNIVNDYLKEKLNEH